MRAEKGGGGCGGPGVGAQYVEGGLFARCPTISA